MFGWRKSLQITLLNKLGLVVSYQLRVYMHNFDVIVSCSYVLSFTNFFF